MAFPTLPNPAPGNAVQASHVDDLASGIQYLRAGTGGSFFARAGGTQSIANVTDVPIAFSTEDRDTAGGHSTSSTTSRYTVPSGCAGWYELSGQVSFASAASGYRIAKIMLVAFVVAANQSIGQSVATQVAVPTVQVHLNVGDYVQLLARQNTGGALNTDTGDGSSWLYVQMVNPD